MSNSSFTSREFLQRSLVTTKQHPQIVKLLARLTGCDNSSVSKGFILGNYFITYWVFFTELFRCKPADLEFKRSACTHPTEGHQTPLGRNELQNIAPRGLALCPLIPLKHCSPLTNYQQLLFLQDFFSKQTEFLYIIMHSTNIC